MFDRYLVTLDFFTKNMQVIKPHSNVSNYRTQYSRRNFLLPFKEEMDDLLSELLLPYYLHNLSYLSSFNRHYVCNIYAFTATLLFLMHECLNASFEKDY